MLHEKFVAAGAIAVAVTLATIFWLRPLARRIGLVDRPNSRKRHRGRVPLIGGLCFFVGTIAGLIYFGDFDPFIVSLLVSGAIVVLFGMLDDLYDLTPRSRLLIQAGAVVLVMAATGVYVESAGALLGDRELRLSWLGIPFTVVAVVGMVNAFNMLDGIDGLAGSLAMISIAAILAFTGVQWPMPSVLLMLGILAIALVPYLLVNLGWPDGRRIFMGDAGSMLIGFVLAWSVIHLSQRDKVLAPVDALWCVALPVMDTLAVMYQRMRQGLSPFRADRRHLHHLLLDAGLSARKALALIVIAAGLLAALGRALHEAPEALSLVVFLGVLVAYVLHLQRAMAWLRLAAYGQLPRMPQWMSGAISMGLRKSWIQALLGQRGEVPSPSPWSPEAIAVDRSGLARIAATAAVDGNSRPKQPEPHDERVKALCVLDGTPEDLEMVPVVQQLLADARFNARICVAGQWDEDALAHAQHAGDGAGGADDRQDAPEVVSRVLGEMKQMFSAFNPDVVLVHGESPAVLATALVAYYQEVPVARMESEAPVAVDARRPDATDGGKLVRTLTSLHFTSTERTGDDLIAAGIPQDRITVAGHSGAGAAREGHAQERSRDACARIAEALAQLPEGGRPRDGAAARPAKHEGVRSRNIPSAEHAGHRASMPTAAGDRT